MGRRIESEFRDAYPQVLALARARLAREHAPISAATLTHELFLQLHDRRDLRFLNRGQFLSYVGRAMRSLLVDMARARIARKRSADLTRLTPGSNVQDHAGTPEQLVALDEALERLGKLDARLLEVAQLRVIVGMDIADIAAALGVSEPTIKRDWQRAKAFLYDTLGAKIRASGSGRRTRGASALRLQRTSVRGSGTSAAAASDRAGSRDEPRPDNGNTETRRCKSYGSARQATIIRAPRRPTPRRT
jgi:RNA polymerase sigma factor (TIGR02999 family)